MPKVLLLSRRLKISPYHLAGIAVAICIFSSQAANKTLIAFTTIPGLLEEQGEQAPYTQIFNQLNTMIDTTMSFEYFPSSRASKSFSDKKSDCLFPGSAKVLRKTHQGPVIASQPVNYAIAYVFSLHEFDLDTLINSAKPRQTISYRRGNTFGGNITKLQKHNLFEVNTDEQSLGLLDHGRVDYVITYMPDARDLILRTDGQQVFYNPEQAFHIQGDSLLCHQTEQNEALIKQINQAIVTLKASGELRRILGKSYIQPN